MSKKPRPGTTPPGSITVGDINEATGVAIGHGAKAIVTQTSGAGDEIAKAFAAILQKVEVMPEGPAKDDAKGAVNKLEAEARKGKQADEGRVRRLLTFLVEASPDVWDVAINTLVNPITGVGTVFKKIAERVKAERETKK
jgi:hypothetical protein